MTSTAGAHAASAVSGYAHPAYAQSLAEFGEPRLLPRSGGWILEREIPGTPWRDALGCYPIFSCRDWSHLEEELAHVGPDLVSLTLVADPFGNHDEAYLRRCFPDWVRPFKQHYVVDLTGSPELNISAHHHREVRRAIRRVHVEFCPSPRDMLDDWMALYTTLASRHTITGIRAFSRESFARQLEVPGLVMFRAVAGDEVVGANLVFAHDDVVHGHLMAQSERGYALGAPYAMYWSAIAHFTGRARWYDLGATPGRMATAGSGLQRFKQGWTRALRTAYLCGRVINRGAYNELTAASGTPDDEYFPAYRSGEFD